MNAAIPFVDIMFGNETEAQAMGEKHGWGTDIATIAKNIAALPKASGLKSRTVVITQGSTSTVVVQNGQVTEYAVEPLAKEALVDTNGAGDAFVGGFLAQLALDQDMAKCVDAGHWAARVIIQRSGCSYPEVCEYK
jgi:adenosine kinase